MSKRCIRDARSAHTSSAWRIVSRDAYAHSALFSRCYSFAERHRQLGWRVSVYLERQNAKRVGGGADAVVVLDAGQDTSAGSFGKETFLTTVTLRVAVRFGRPAS